MRINIYGSTGVIGCKSLSLIDKYFPNIKVNLLCANSNYKLLIRQCNLFKPKYIYINDYNHYLNLKTILNNKTKVLNYAELLKYLKNSKSDLSILAVSGYKSLNYLDHIINNSDNVGIVSKEAIVSAGHIFKTKKFFNKINIFPLDSEHYSLYDLFVNGFNKNNIKNIILTASGGPFYTKKFNDLNNVTFKQAIKHPKWKMGYKNSIDSATLVNKCLEVIEAHYLFDIPFNKIKVLIHPEAIVHSIIQNCNYTSNMNLFKNDMDIPIINFLMKSKKSKKYNFKENLHFKNYNCFNFKQIEKEYFPIYSFFSNLDKSDPKNIIKFNIGNEYAVNLFKNGLIKYTEIYKIIKKICSLKLYYNTNTIKDIIIFHEKFEKN